MSLDVKYCEETDLREFSFSDHKSFMDEFGGKSTVGVRRMIQRGNEENMHELKSTGKITVANLNST